MSWLANFSRASRRLLNLIYWFDQFVGFLDVRRTLYSRKHATAPLTVAMARRTIRGTHYTPVSPAPLSRPYRRPTLPPRRDLEAKKSSAESSVLSSSRPYLLFFLPCSPQSFSKKRGLPSSHGFFVHRFLHSLEEGSVRSLSNPY